MTFNRSYAKRISSEEEQEGYILIVRDMLPFFPPQGKSFTLSTGNDSRSVSVESYDCQCRGPKLLHEHYFVRWSGLRRGQTIIVHRSLASTKEYCLTVN